MNERGWARNRPGGESGEERLIERGSGARGQERASGKLRGENEENLMNACEQGVCVRHRHTDTPAQHNARASRRLVVVKGGWRAQEDQGVVAKVKAGGGVGVGGRELR